MTAPNDGGPAFPVPGLSSLPNGEFIHPTGGMSLRDKFAESALVGLLAEPINNGQRSTVVVVTGRRSEDGKEAADHFAEAAYVLADAMLRAREVKS